MDEWTVERVYRYCARCARWRSIGNFARCHIKGKTYHARTCMRCWRPGIKNANRHGYVLTEQGRAYLHPERAERAS
jgi:hypothetical protein